MTVTAEQLQAWLAFKAAVDRMSPLFVGSTPAEKLDGLPIEIDRARALLGTLGRATTLANIRRVRA